jgi:hypothetical protein
MRKIYFVKYYDKGSTDISAHQIADGLARRGWDARAIYARETKALSRSILVFIKTSRLDHLLLARAHGNRLVLDVHDTICFKRRIKNRWLFDGLIFKNRAGLADFGRPGKPDRVIYHQWDERYSPNRAPRDRMVLGYLGEPRSLEVWGELPPEIELISPRTPGGWFGSAPRYNCHLSIRRPGKEARYKSNCKVSTAAICEANLITTRDVTTVELLGEDYPYYCEADRESILAAIERARLSFGSAEWQRGLARLAAVRELTSMDRVLDEYESLFHELARPWLANTEHAAHARSAAAP